MEASTTTGRGPDKDAAWRYGMAGLAAAIGIAARFALNPLLGLKLSYITFFPAVVFATWTGGVGPGLLCIALTSLAAAVLYLPSATSLWIGDPTDAAGLVIYGLVSTMLVAMIGAQRAAERRASASTDSARAAHGEVTAILASITDSFYAVDRDWRFTYLNPQAVRYFGRAHDALLGKTFWDAIPEKRGTAFESGFRTAMRENVPVQFEALSPATHRWVDVHAYPRPEGLSIFFRDITDRKRAESEREQLLARANQARREAEQANRAKDDFLATVSHELRTPLTPILSWARLLRAGTLDAATQARALETVERSARSQAQLIEDLLDVSRIIAGKIRLDVRRVELGPVIERAIESLRPAADAKGIRLQTVVDPRAGLISADPERIQQVMWNLLSNAIKFTPKDGRVQVILQRINSHVDIVVSDTGRGISGEFLPYVFDRFRQAEPPTTRTHGGLGLGLAIVRHMVELHGGTVMCESLGEGRGTTFTVRLPIAVLQSQPREDDVHPRASDGAPIAVAPTLAGVSVLLVDDERDTLETIAVVLQEFGAEVRTALGTEEAFAILASWRPTVLVSDIGMPGSDGYELIGRVRGLAPESGGRIPAIALTAYARVEDRMRVLSAGFQMHVAKPIEPAELVAVVASVATWPASVTGASRPSVPPPTAAEGGAG
jgi:PAS domain S-box-containing protein